jgi:glycine oxidase
MLQDSPEPSRSTCDAIVVGAGAVGLAVAHALAGLRLRVLVIDAGVPQSAASWAAAGMIAPQSEAAEPGLLFELGVGSARLYPDWVRELQAESGIDVEYATPGVLFVATSEERRAALRHAVEWQSAARFQAKWLTPEEAGDLEPAITVPLLGAAWMPDEAQVTPRKLLWALRSACQRRGVEFRESTVEEILRGSRRVEGVRTSAGRILAGHVVLTAGVGSGPLGGIPVTPRKGQILALGASATRFRHIVRWEHAYVVSRPTGEQIVGATNEDAGFDRSVTAAGIGGLLDKVQHLASGLGAAPVLDMWAGLRPMAPDGLPLIGRSVVEGLVYATAHYRNGVLLAPLTAEIIAAGIAGAQPAGVTTAALDAVSPERFAV